MSANNITPANHSITDEQVTISSSRNRTTSDFQTKIEKDDDINNVSNVTITPDITYCWINIAAKVQDQTPCFKDKLLDLCSPKKSVKPEKPILRNVSGYVKPGELVGIMGASGAGKSTLLNVLASRNLEKLNVTGNCFANGIKVNQTTLSVISAYIQQDELFIGSLTVKEHLTFQAMVKMNRKLPNKLKQERVSDVIHDLLLTKCANTIIGNGIFSKGISGGERKRLSFASAILTSPSLLFIDEPTSGLDSHMAHNVVEILNKMAGRGKSIVCTIHQPNSRTFGYFHKLILLTEGRVAFFGSTLDALKFFEELRFPCPENYNPADHFIEILGHEPGMETSGQMMNEYICQVYEDRIGAKEMKEVISHMPPESQLKQELDHLQEHPFKASAGIQFRALLWRNILAIIKDPLLLRIKFLEVTGIALLLGIIFFRIGNDYDQNAIKDINGALFFSILVATYSNYNIVITSFSMELPIFHREYQDGLYRAPIYFMARQIADFPLHVMFSILFMLIYYWMVGLYYSFPAFAIMASLHVITTQCTVSLGYFLSGIFSSVQVAIIMASPIIVPFMIFGGVFMGTASVPSYFIWMKYISWFYYGYEILLINQWRNVDQIHCYWSGLESSNCFGNGTQIIYREVENLEHTESVFDERIVRNFTILLTIILVLRLLAFIALYRRVSRR